MLNVVEFMMNVLDNDRSEMAGGSGEMVDGSSRNDAPIAEALILISWLMCWLGLKGMVNRTSVRQGSEGWIVS